MKRTGVCCLIALAGALVLPAMSWGQEAVIWPNPLDFGLVELGSSRTLFLTIGAGDISPLIVTAVDLPDDVGGAFTVLDVICSDPTFQYPDVFDLPSVLYQGSTLRADVLYAPVSLGTHAGWLRVECNDHADPEIYIPVMGRSVPAVPAPSALLLLGSGLVSLRGLRKPCSAQRRRRARI